MLEAEFVRELGENLRGVVEVVARIEGLRVVGQPGGIFDVVNVVPEPLQADDVMDVLPDDAGDRHRAHEAHHDDAFAFHWIDREEAGRRRGTFQRLNVQLPTSDSKDGELSHEADRHGVER